MLLQSTIHPGYKDQGRRLMASLVPNGLFQGVATMNLPTKWACNPLLACVQPLLFLHAGYPLLANNVSKFADEMLLAKIPFFETQKPFFP